MRRVIAYLPIGGGCPGVTSSADDGALVDIARSKQTVFLRLMPVRSGSDIMETERDEGRVGGMV